MFSIGDLVVVELAGIVRPLAKENEGKTGEVVVVNLNYPFPYTVHLDTGRKLNFAADELAPLARKADDDAVNHPAHYTWLPNGVEVIDITEHLNFNLGNVVKYACRAGRKTNDPTEDLKKTIWYAKRELQRIEAAKAEELSH